MLPCVQKRQNCNQFAQLKVKKIVENPLSVKKEAKNCQQQNVDSCQHTFKWQRERFNCCTYIFLVTIALHIDCMHSALIILAYGEKRKFEWGNLKGKLSEN